MAFKKLQAVVESGATFDSYSAALAEAKFRFTLFRESDAAQQSPEFLTALQNTMKWYQAAGQLWSRKRSTNSIHGVCEPNQYIEALDLCEAYPELITVGDRKTFVSGSKVMWYSVGIDKAWQLASQELRKADQYLRQS